MDKKITDILSEFAQNFNRELSEFSKEFRNNPLYNTEMSAVFDAFDYSLLSGGKRLRAFLVYTFNKLCGGKQENALPHAIAIEMIHAYSLIHDDLPCMDNDDLRRGKPTNHKVYGEATALLAGDALLTEAFSLISNANITERAKLDSIRLLSCNAGIFGMIGGQEIDLKSENSNISLETLILLQNRKTGKLFEAACLLGCISANNYDKNITAAASSFAASFGLAFQITDDILDVIGETETLGKSVGSDEKTHKSTFVSLLGIDGAKNEALKQVASAKDVLKSAFYEADIIPLCDLCDYLITRRS